MHVCLTAFPPDRAAIVRPLRPGEVVRIGRAPDSELRIDHASVSRTHARLSHGRGGWRLHDLGSKNGSFVDGQRIPELQEYPLEHARWLRFGDVYCELALLDDEQTVAAESARRARRAAATAHTARMEGAQHLDQLLDASLHGVLELAQCARGFVLLRQEGPDAGERFVVAAARSLDPSALAGREFSGSVGAVQRALRERRSVIVNDIVSDAWLSSRASVAAAGLSALVCVPLHDAAQALGAIYADRTQPGPPLTTLDQELLEAFAERAALWIAARRTSELLAAQAQDAPPHEWNRILAAHPSGMPHAE